LPIYIFISTNSMSTPLEKLSQMVGEEGQGQEEQIVQDTGEDEMDETNKEDIAVADDTSTMPALDKIGQFVCFYGKFPFQINNISQNRSYVPTRFVWSWIRGLRASTKSC